tara:strand:- start:2476 stop:3216 length:741 start_codon:yes stop_codon:yes gene_type:complete
MILKNKTIFITGIGKGIGKAICETSLKNGAFVYGLTRTRKDLDAIEKNLNLKIFIGDVNNVNLIKRVFLDAKKNKKKITGIVNNAGIRFRKPFLKITKKDLNNVFNNNFFSIFQIIQEYIRYLGKNNKNFCSIVNVGSIVGKIGFSELSAYASTKSALTGLTKSLSKEFAHNKIRLNIVNPGFVKTSYYEKFKKNKKLYKWTLSRIPANKWGEPEDISEFIVFLLSDKSKYFNGEDISIDGGWLSS